MTQNRTVDSRATLAARAHGRLSSLGRGHNVSVKRTLVDGDCIALHLEYDEGGQRFAGFDVFRFEGDKVAEHWTIRQPVPGTTKSGRGLTDGASDIVDTAKTDVNKALVERFIRDVLCGGKREKIPDYVSTVDYAQHSPKMGDGVAGLTEAFAEMQANGKALRRYTAERFLGEGNFVLALSEVVLGDTTTRVFDMWRLENGKIVEHWDIVER